MFDILLHTWVCTSIIHLIWILSIVFSKLFQKPSFTIRLLLALANALLQFDIQLGYNILGFLKKGTYEYNFKTIYLFSTFSTSYVDRC